MESQLRTIVEQSGLEVAKAQVMLDSFNGYFALAAEWEVKAKTIVVTSETQTAEMQMARAGRLFLKEKRVSIEKTRKSLKEQALREGKAIDGIANVLKALIVPIEQHLSAQEKFIENRDKAAAEKARHEADEKAEAERLAKEQAEKAERERIRLENIKLKQEAEAKERALEAERAKVRAEKEASERKAKAERARLKKEAEAEKQEIQAEAEARLSEERAKTLKAEQGGAKALSVGGTSIECPHCHKTFSFKPEKG